MKKRVLMVSLSMVMVLGLAGIVNATTIGKNTTDMQPRVSNAQTYMDNNDVTSTEVEQVETTQPDQTVPSQTDVYDQMRSSNVSMNDQMQNMPQNTQMQNIPMNTQMQNMPMNTQMSDQMINSQHTQGMVETNKPNNSNASQQPAQKSSGNNMMGSKGSMGR
ncbi:hypothetical protein [Desulfosporosinus burensis]